MAMRLERLTKLLGKALAGGATRQGDQLNAFEWDVAGNCTSPVPRELSARPSAPHRRERAKLFGSQPGWKKDFPSLRFGKQPEREAKRVIVGPGKQKSASLLLQTRCRRCDNCRKYKSRHWAKRALQELQLSHRTWFVTLTLSPRAQTYCLNLARRQISQNFEVDPSTGECVSDDYDGLPFDEQFARRHAVASVELTKWLKRVRKRRPGARFTYLMVAEAHLTGLPHYHLLVHDKAEREWQQENQGYCSWPRQEPLREEDIRSPWQWGISQAKLVRIEDQKKAPWYVCKYVSKSAAARVRSSQRYGQREVRPQT